MSPDQPRLGADQMPTAGRRATAKDVAQRAGVSRSAVSMVLNGHGNGNIAPAKQGAIRRAAAELHYRPNRVGRSLRSKRTHTIGVVTDAIASHAFGGELLAGVADVALQHGYLALVVDTQNRAEREGPSVDTLRDREIDGMVFAALSLRAWSPGDLVDGLPTVLANATDPTGRVPDVLPDETAGGAAACRELLEHGHRRIAMLAGAPEFMATRLRWQGHSAALRQAGVSQATRITAGWSIRDGYQAAAQVLADPQPPTALACANDRVAVGAILAALSFGLSVPGDLSVIGYDDDENVAPEMMPALTTVALPHRALGERAAQLLLASIESGGIRSGSVESGEIGSGGTESGEIESEEIEFGEVASGGTESGEVGAGGIAAEPPPLGRAPQQTLPCAVVRRDSVGPPSVTAP